MNTGPSDVLNSPDLLVVDAGADEVGGHEVGRELDALELAADRAGERLDRHRLGETGHALHQHVPAREQRDDQPFEQVVLPDDDLLDLVEHLLHGLVGAGCVVHRVGTSMRRSGSSSRVGQRRRVRRAAARGRDRDGEADADEEALRPVGLASAVTMPTTWPSRFSSGPPELPGFTAASNWISPSSSPLPSSRPMRAVESRDDAGGDRVGETERVADREGFVADLHAAAEDRGHDDAREPTRARAPRCRARGRRRRPRAGDSVPSANVTLIARGVRRPRGAR